MARAKKTKGSTVKVNFKGVESRRTPPEGDYVLEVLEAKSGTSGAGNEQIEFVLEISKGEYKGQKMYFYCPLAESSLWKLHAFLTALGEDVPEDEIDVDLSDLVGKEVVGVISHEIYNGKKRAKMTDFDSLENYKGGDESDDEDDEDEAPAKSKKSKAPAKSRRPSLKKTMTRTKLRRSPRSPRAKRSRRMTMTTTMNRRRSPRQRAKRSPPRKRRRPTRLKRSRTWTRMISKRLSTSMTWMSISTTSRSCRRRSPRLLPLSRKKTSSTTRTKLLR